MLIWMKKEALGHPGWEEQVKRVQSGPKVRGNSMYRVTKNPRSQGVLVAGRDSVPTFAGRDSIPTLRAEAARDTFAGRVLG